MTVLDLLETIIVEGHTTLRTGLSEAAGVATNAQDRLADSFGDATAVPSEVVRAGAEPAAEVASEPFRVLKVAVGAAALVAVGDLAFNQGRLLRWRG